MSLDVQNPVKLLHYKYLMSMKGPIENAIYSAVLGFCEENEMNGIIRKNGHHAAQKISHLVSKALLSPQRKKIYEVIEGEMTSKEIADKLGMTSKSVSAILIAMKNTTLLISSKKRGIKITVWSKNII